MGYHGLSWIWGEFVFSIFCWKKHGGKFEIILNLKNPRGANSPISIDAHHITLLLVINNLKYAN